MKENLVEEYYKKLYSGEKHPSKVLTEFFSELFDIQLTSENLIMFSKLTKLFSKEVVFNAIIDIYGIENLDVERNLYGLLVSICKRYSLPSVDISENLVEKIEKIKKSKSKPKIIGDPFGE